MTKFKRALALLLIFAALAGLCGCASEVDKDNITPLGEAYLALYGARRDIEGYEKDCIIYDQGSDELYIYAAPELDCEAVVKLLNHTVNGRECGTVSLRSYAEKVSKDHYETHGIDPLLQAFSRGFSAPLNRLYLYAPRQEFDPQLWKDSLQRLDFVKQLLLSTDSDGKLDYLKDIAGDGKIDSPFGELVLGLVSSGSYDVSALDCFSGLETLIFEGFYVGSSVLPELGGLEALSERPVIDMNAFSCNLSLAKLTYKLRALGFTVEGVSENPREDLEQNQPSALELYDSFVAEYNTYTSIVAGEGDYWQRLEDYKALLVKYLKYDKAMVDAGLDLLREFYSLAGSPDFDDYVQKMCSCHEGRDSHHRYILESLASLTRGTEHWDSFFSALTGMLPTYGDWCLSPVTVTDFSGAVLETNALRTLMDAYDMLALGKQASGERIGILSDENSKSLINACDEKGLLCGELCASAFNGDFSHDVPLAEELQAKGLLTAEEAEQLRFEASDERLCGIGDLDSFLREVSFIDSNFEQFAYGQFASNISYGFYGTMPEDCLSVDSNLLKLSRFVPDSGAAGESAGGRRVIFAVVPKNGTELVFPKCAYLKIKSSSGDFRTIPAANTPGSLDEAELIIIPSLDYYFAGTYTDGSSGFACTATVYAYEIASGRCVACLGSTDTQPPQSVSGASRLDTYAVPNSYDISLLVSRWLERG